MSQRRIIGLDPGRSGGAFWLDADGNFQTAKMPDADGSICDLLRSAVASGVNEAAIELIPRYIGHAIPSSSAAVLFENYGFLKGALAAMGVRTILYTPQTWQKPLALGTVAGSGGRSAWKKKLHAESMRRFPNVHLTLSTCDAALIYDYANTH